jgi:hypothetical protein
MSGRCGARGPDEPGPYGAAVEAWLASLVPIARPREVK